MLLFVLACVEPQVEPPDSADTGTDTGTDTDTEACNGVDDDGDGLVDGDDPDLNPDADGDGHEGPCGYATDCDDSNPDVHPRNTELCNGIDDDCDTFVDDDDPYVEGIAWYADRDDDGYGSGSVVALACENPGTAVDNADDCLDTNASVHPGAAEVCNGSDDDCDDLIDGQDDDVVAYTWYTDADGDGYGDPATPFVSCDDHDRVSDGTDCNDADSAVNAAAAELCDSRDNDCDGAVDDDDPVPVDASPWFTDADGDGHGDPAAYVLACVQPADTVDNGHDCDDADGASQACADSPDDGSVCPDAFGVDQGGVPAWTGTCDTAIGLFEFEGHCYWLEEDPASSEDARATCAAAGGYLVTSTSSREDDMLGEQGRYILLGACQDEDGWGWITGEAWNHQRWTTGHPGVDTCTYQGYVPVRERWSSIPCTHSDVYVCEFGEVTVASEREVAAADCASVTSTTPTAEAVGVAVDGALTIAFDAAMSSLDLHVWGEVSGDLDGTVTWDGATATWTPVGAARAGERVTAVVTDASRCADGGRATPWSWSWHAGVDGGVATFTEVATGLTGGFDGAALANFDGDDALEIVVSTATGIEVIDGAELGSPVVLGTTSTNGYSDLVAFDADGDGDTDVAAIHASDLTLTVWLGDGAGGLVEQDIETFTDLPWDLDVADVDLDGALDLVVSAYDDAYYVWLRNDGAGDFGYRAEDIANTGELRGVAVADVDADGDPDLVGIAGRDTVDVRLNDRADRFSQGPEDEETNRGGEDIWTGDLDGDGTIDLAVCTQNRDVLLFLGNGEGDFDEEDAEGDYGDEIGGGDFDADEDLDLLVRTYWGGAIDLWENDAGDVQAGTSFGPGDRPNSMAIGDIDGDGVLDVVWAGESELAVFLGDP